MPGGKGNIRPEDNPKPFKTGVSGNPNGQPPSIKKQVRELLALNEELEIRWADLISIEEGDSIRVRLPVQMATAVKLFQWAMSNNPVASLNAIQIMLEHIDGKPAQSINFHNDQPIQQIELTDEQLAEAMQELKPPGF